MKIIAILAILLLIITSPVVYGSELMTIEGALSEENLNIESSAIIENNIDWNTPGTYTITYYDAVTKQICEKEILIVAKAELLSGIDMQEETTVYQNADTAIIKVQFVDKNRFYLIGTISMDKPYQGRHNQEFAYIAYFENGIKEWSDIIHQDRYGSVKDACLTDTGIAIIGDFDDYNNYRDIFIREYSTDGMILLEKDLGGTSDDYGQKIFTLNNRLFFAGTTFSDDGIFQDYTNGDSTIIIGSLLRSNPDSLEVNGVGNSGIDVLYDAVCLNNRIYLFLRFVGDGYFSKNQENQFLSLLTVDDRLEIREWISLEQYNLFDVRRLAIVSDTLALVLGGYQNSYLDLLYFQEDLEYRNRDRISVNCEVLDFCFYEDYLSVYGRNELGYSLSVVLVEDSEFQILSEAKLKHPAEILSVYQTDSMQILSAYVSEGKVKIGSNTNFRLEETVKEHRDYVFYENRLYINGTPLPFTLYESNIALNPFGTYTNLYCYKYQDKDIIIPMDLFFPGDINVKSKGVYDVGVSLRFNGTGYLNGNEINNGYRVETEGHYVLEIVGSEGITQAVSFQVSRLSEDEPIEEETFPVSFQFVDTEKQVHSNIPYLEVKRKEPESNDENYFYILLGGAFLGVFAGLILKKKVKHD